MLLDTDTNILDSFEKLITSEPTRENLKACGCILLKDNPNRDREDWVVIYKGERYEFTRKSYLDLPARLEIYCKHYNNPEKTSWLIYGHESANNLKELFEWIDAEIEFYKDHPEEKYGSPEWERKGQQTEVIRQVFDDIRWKYNLNKHRYYSVGYAPKDDDDVVWYYLYAEACKVAKQKHPELFV